MQSVAVTDADDLQDPFEITYNVARTVTKDGLYTVSCYANCSESPLLTAWYSLDSRRIHARYKSM